MPKKYLAEFIGTFFLVFAGVGSALLTAAVPGVGIGLLGVSLAFGLAVMTMAYVLGPISGCHLNPAVTFGLWVNGLFPKSDVLGYVVMQVLGGAAGAFALFVIAKGGPDLQAMIAGGFASNGFGEHSPGGYSQDAVMMTEIMATMMFVIIILGATCKKMPAGFAPICIGLGLTLLHLMAIHVSNASLNPARSMATALIGRQWATDQLWMFWVAPCIGAAIGAYIYKNILCDGDCNK
ncbi:MAG: aquaporin Z [Proteobacteria bacterium]|nr:aquaporin Z [Pseudomonadota bacterium]